MIKMIVTDLDGTLLRHDKTVSKYTAAIFRRCTHRGIKVVFATARPIRAVKMLNIPILFDGAIYHNGAVVDTGNKNILHFGISPKNTKEIVSEVLNYDVRARICIEINDSIYSNTDASDIWPGIKIIPTDFNDLPFLSADKIILLTADSQRLETLHKILPENLYFEISENKVAMIMDRDASKANAIIRLCENFCILPDDVAAFGDDYNDMEMIRYCGAGIAVANAIDEVKSVADFICDTNDHDGVAKWIGENIL